MANYKCIKCGYELFPLDKECDRCGTEVACTPAPADMNTSKTKDSKPKRSKNQKSPTDFDIKEAVKIKVTNTINSESSKKSSNKKTLIIILSILSVAIVAAIVIVFIKKNTTAPTNISDTAKTEMDVIEPNADEAETINESTTESEGLKTETESAKEIDYTSINDWFESFEVPPLFAIWNTISDEKTPIRVDEVYELNDGEQLLLYYGNKGKYSEMEFSPSDVTSEAALQDKEGYYIVPIAKSGELTIKFKGKYGDHNIIEGSVSIINNKSEVDDIKGQIIPAEDWLKQITNEIEWATLVVWNEETGNRQIISKEEYEIKRADNFAVVAPFDIGSCICRINIDMNFDDLNIEGNIAYLRFPDSCEINQFFARVSPTDGIDLGPSVTGNSHNVMAYFTNSELDNSQNNEATVLSDEQISVWFDEIAKNCEQPEIVVWNKDTGTKEIMPNKYEPQEGDQFAVITNFEIGDCKPQVTKGKVEATIVDTNRIDLYYNFTGISGKVDTVVVTTPKNKENDSIDPYAMGSFMITNGRK